MKDILSYNDFYKDTYEYTRIGNKSELTNDRLPDNIKRFFSAKSICPFCKNDTYMVFKGSKPRRAPEKERRKNIKWEDFALIFSWGNLWLARPAKPGKRWRFTSIGSKIPSTITVIQ